MENIGNFLKDKDIGYEFAVPTADGFADMVFRLVDKNNVTALDNDNNQTTKTVTCMSTTCIKTSDSSYFALKFDKDGSHRWYNSTLRDFLNSESISGETRSAFLGAFLVNKEGIDLEIAQAFLNSIRPVKNVTYKSDDTYDKVWLPTVPQLNNGSNYDEGLYSSKDRNDKLTYFAIDYPVSRIRTLGSDIWTRSFAEGAIGITSGVAAFEDTEFLAYFASSGMRIAPCITFVYD